MIYFEGQIYDAYSKLVDIMNKASKSLVIIDGYADKIVLDMISKLNVDVYLIIRNNSLLSKLDISKYNEQYNNLKVIYSDLFHDRYIILDDNIIYHCGSSLNKAGTRIFSINILEETEIKESLLNKMKKVLTHFINFVLGVTIFIFVIILIVKTTVLNEKYIFKTLEDNYYYSEIYDIIINNFESNLIQSGLDDNIIYELITKEKVENDVKTVLQGIYHNIEINIDTNILTKNLNNKVDEIFKSLHRTPNKEEQEDIKRLENTIVEVYKDEITYDLNTVNSISAKVVKINTIVNSLLIILGIIIVVLLLVEMFLFNEFIRNMGIAILSSSLITIIIRLIIGSKYKNILIFNEIFSKIVVSVVNNFLTNVFVIGIYLSIIGLVLIIIEIYKKILMNK